MNTAKKTATKQKIHRAASKKYKVTPGKVYSPPNVWQSELLLKGVC